MSFKDVMHTISIWIIILPFIAGIVNYKRLDKDSGWIFLMVLFALTPQILTPIIDKELPLFNYSYNIYTPLEFFLVWQMFRFNMQRKINRKIMLYSALAYSLISLFVLFTHNIEKAFINVWVCVNNLFYLLWILIFLLEQYHSDNIILSRNRPFAWYLMAFIVYAPCSLIVFSLYHYIRSGNNLIIKNLWIIQDFCNIFLYVFFTIGLIISKRHNKAVLSARI